MLPSPYMAHICALAPQLQSRESSGKSHCLCHTWLSLSEPIYRMSVPDKAKVARTQHSAKQTEPAIPVDEISSDSDAGDKRMVSVTQATPKKTK
jgi:hypothetical protein